MMTQDDNFVKTPSVLCVCMIWSQSPRFELPVHGQVIPYQVDKYCHECRVQNASIVMRDRYL